MWEHPLPCSMALKDRSNDKGIVGTQTCFVMLDAASSNRAEFSFARKTSNRKRFMSIDNDCFCLIQWVFGIETDAFGQQTPASAAVSYWQTTWRFALNSVRSIWKRQSEPVWEESSWLHPLHGVHTLWLLLLLFCWGHRVRPQRAGSLMLHTVSHSERFQRKQGLSLSGFMWGEREYQWVK